MQYAPIIVFAFNRLGVLKKTITSLLANPESKESDIYIFVDGPRPEKEGDSVKVQAVIDYVTSVTGFKSTNYYISKKNAGLGPSVIAGVSRIINQFGRAIIVEDDLDVNKNFLAFMNQGLERYEHNSRVFSICGYTNKVLPPKGYNYDSYFCTRSSSWGWATWSDRWNNVNWELEPWDNYTIHAKGFNKWGGSDCWHMLNEWHNGKNKSWAIRFCFAQFLQDKVSLFPIKSLVQNNGFDGEGTNCKKWNRFKYELEDNDKRQFAWPIEISINKDLQGQALKYHSLILRAYSKFMYLIHR